MNRDPRCVFVAETLIEANLVVSWLEQQGIAAQVATLNSHERYDALATFAFASGNLRGIEVWVDNPEEITAATSLLTQREWSRIAKAASVDVADDGVPVLCDKCGQVALFPTVDRGTCQNCPHCGAYVDVDEAEEEDEPAAEIKPPPPDGIRLPPFIQRESD